MTTMTMKTEKEWKKKLEEADCIMDSVLCHIKYGIDEVGESGKKVFALFVEEIGTDGKTHTRRL